MMELKELCEKTLKMFSVNSVDDLGDALLSACKDNNADKLKEFADMVGDLSVDWLQMIYQYYQADRKNKGQDYTPKSLARLCGMLIGNDNAVIDMCAGSGAMTIQKWNMNPNTTFTEYEVDKNVIPYLLFNMMLRNINCSIIESDVLQDETSTIYTVTKGERFGICKEVQKCQA